MVIYPTDSLTHLLNNPGQISGPAQFSAVTLQRNEKESKTPVLDSAWENFLDGAMLPEKRKLKNGQRQFLQVVW